MFIIRYSFDFQNLNCVHWKKKLKFLDLARRFTKIQYNPSVLTVIPNSFDLSTETLETSRYPAFTKAFMKQQFLLLPVIYGSSFYNVLISLLNRVSTKIFVFEMLSVHKYPFSINLSCLSVKYKYVYLRMILIIDLNHWVPWEFFHALTN